jgi:GWxTD domain-containing protein
MKKYIIYIGCFLICLQSAFAIEASVGYAVYKSPNSPYLEVSIYVLGNSVRFIPASKGSIEKQAKVNITIEIKQGEKIVAFEKMRLNSPLTEKFIHFSDVKRINLPEGSYDLNVHLQDVNNPEDTINYGEQLKVVFSGVVQQSDLQLLGSFSASEDQNAFVKQGIFMETLPFNYYNRKYKVLAFYQEVYWEVENYEDSLYLCKYAIHKESDGKIGDEIMAMYKRRTVKSTDPMLFQMDIATLPSGNYFLQVSVQNRNRETLSTKDLYFIRSNPDFDHQITLAELSKISESNSADFTKELDSIELRFSLRALMPLIPQRDAEVLKIIISESDTAAMRRFLFNHYLTHYKTNPYQGYTKYMEVARAVDKMYNNGFGYGFETDRGYFFLKYGKPDDIQAINDDPSAPPYEIWFYNSLVQTNQSNVKFVFYNPSLASNGHVLLHSTARGEWNNPKWEVMLYRYVPDQMEGDNYMDGNRMQDNWNRHARRYYDDF